MAPGAYTAAAAAVRDHPLLVQAAADGKMWKTEEQLRAVVPQVMVVVRPAAGGGERVVVLLGGVEQPAPAA
ncbi:hypothetical protein [Kitasatospora acidiphila]|uniref:hypothetical protein n=1 Tax=Kitasatospora acidiphila TaxID=2567942 RepID=UPI003C72138C